MCEGAKERETETERGIEGIGYEGICTCIYIHQQNSGSSRRATKNPWILLDVAWPIFRPVPKPVLRFAIICDGDVLVQ